MKQFELLGIMMCLCTNTSVELALTVSTVPYPVPGSSSPSLALGLDIQMIVGLTVVPRDIYDYISDLTLPCIA